MISRSANAAPGATAEATMDGDGTLTVRGVLSFDTVPDVFAKSAVWLQKSQGAITIDLENVDRADSAGLALLIEWLQLARRRNLSLTFANMPEQVRSLARVNGLSNALGVAGS